MKKFILELILILIATAAIADQQYSYYPVSSVTPSNITMEYSSLMYGYNGTNYYIPMIDSGGNVRVMKNTDTGRTSISLYANAAAAGTTGTETAITLTKSTIASSSTGTSFVVTSGKKFRITEFSVATRGHLTATAQITTFNFRVNSSGIISATSGTVIAASSATPATSLAWDRYIVPIPEGFELTGDGTLQFGITSSATYTTNAPTWFVNIVGYEY